MSENDEVLGTDQIELTVDIVSAYVSNNHIQAVDLPALIGTVHAALSDLSKPAEAVEAPVEKLTPAQIRKSITPDALVSFIDGKPYKTLKRHLTKHGMDFQAYRQRFGLPADYPATAASYSAKRSELARSLGLGRKSEAAAREAEPVETVSEAPAEAPKTRGRRSKPAEAAAPAKGRGRKKSAAEAAE
ncbi:MULTISPECIES: MucR family transcriptional regulator [Methylobacterium]|uniref:MucR family transcriptional regulator n=1 Tax=Methylobacterium hispanicum TaxID=270350 RepID=A0AAV4ZPL7_9HYPH|nr:MULTISPECIES: MucR family transcriptional regulator [Methylobacterium]GJD89831.1 hypothetical protein BHAOGJBA_3363 [Methylobacterium hispanicum]